MVLLLNGTGVLSSGREPHLLRSHLRSLLRRHLSAGTYASYSVGGMDLGFGVDIVHVHLHPQLCCSSEEDISYTLKIWLQ
jgi:hypothetical protein